MPPSASFVLPLLAPLLMASGGDCYLITRDRIALIPCDFKAAATDSLRYAARDEERARPSRPEQRRNAVTSHPGWKNPKRSRSTSRRSSE